MLADDLLQQAYQLATIDQGKPKQSSLRRSNSTAYYAIFHLPVAEAASRVSPKSPHGLNTRIARALVHGEMKAVCKSISSQNPSEVWRELQPDGFSDVLQGRAATFVLLQEERHKADYDLAERFTRTETLDLLDQVRDAFNDWRIVRTHDEANVFLAALLFAARWSK